MITKRMLFLIVLFSCFVGRAQDDATRKLGAFLGKWQSEGTFANGNQVTASLECRWSINSDFLICEQAIKMSGGDHHQLTIYSYNSKTQTYTYTTIGDPGATPTSGTLKVDGNIWTYSTTYEHDGQTTQVRTINEFVNRKENFKVESSDDGGATWRKQLQGTASKVAD
jgi:hypothetical protein